MSLAADAIAALESYHGADCRCCGQRLTETDLRGLDFGEDHENERGHTWDEWRIDIACPECGETYREHLSNDHDRRIWLRVEK